jgi:type I restriction enzyme S subunit
MAKDFCESGVPLIRVAGLSGTSSVLNGCNFLDESKVRQKWDHFRVEPGDTLLSTSASLGRVAIVGNEAKGAVPYTGIIRMRPKGDELIADLIPYLLQSTDFQRQVEAMGVGSVIKHFGPSHLRQMTLSLPPVADQHRIAWLLRSLDDKIELNRKMAETLEAIAAAIFKARFVDFIGVEEFEDSELGPIPRGWTATNAGDVLSPVGGGTPSTKEARFWDGGTHSWATPKDMSGMAGSILMSTGRKLTDEGVKKISSGLLPAGTVLLSSRAPVGYTAISVEPTAINQGFIAIPPNKSSLPSEFTLFWIRENLDEIKRRASGTTFAEISKSKFRPIPLVRPDEPALSEYSSVVAPMLGDMVNLERQIRTLISLRDELLPKLISGKIRVPEGVGHCADQEEAPGDLAESAPDHDDEGVAADTAFVG